MAKRSASVNDVRDALQTIDDPELGVSIVDLGLIYDIAVNGTRTRIQFSLTTPGCPLVGYFQAEIERKAGEVPGIEHVELDLTYDPPWTPDRATEETRIALGMK